VTPGAYCHMDGNVTTIGFEAALWRLKDLLHRPVRVLVNFRGTFGSCALQGKLTRIETLPPDHSAVNILLDDRQAVTIDPIDTEALLAEPADGREWWIEFHLPSGVVISIERDRPAAGLREPGSVTILEPRTNRG
jgi:hypothetical protein